MMHIEVDNKLTVKNPTTDLLKWCDESLRLPNPDYYKRVSMGRWCGGIPDHIQLYERIGEDVCLPFGCVKDVYSRFKPLSFKLLFSPIRIIDYRSEIKLYDYQEKAVDDALKAKNGIIVMPCGAGKTQTALELVSRIGGRTLWLTHTQDLLNQSFQRALSCLGVHRTTYGFITGGKVNIGSGITFATVQTMSKLDLAQYRMAWDVVIVDECHKAVGSPTRVMQFYKVLSGISCRYKFGLTATPKRADGLERSMFALIGDTIHEVSRQEVANTTCPVKVEYVESDYTPNLDCVLSGDGTLNYSALINDLIHDEARYGLVLDEILNCVGKADGYTLILANRVEYVSRLRDSLEAKGIKAVCLSSLGNSKAEKAERKETLRSLNSGLIKCVLATYQLAKEGLDVPNLRYLIFATPEKDEVTVTQSAGRVGRRSEGKQCGVIVDVVDQFGMFRGWAKKRKGYYKKLGYFY